MTTVSVPVSYCAQACRREGSDGDGQGREAASARGPHASSGQKAAEIAVAVGVARQTVYTWKRILEESGIDALREIDRGGRPGSLDEKQFDQIRRALLESPTAHGFGTELWTIKRVRVLIERLHEVRFSEVHVWRILGRRLLRARSPSGGRWSTTRRRSSAGRSASGHALKKSGRRGQADRVRRRIGLERTAYASAHLGHPGDKPLSCSFISIGSSSRSLRD